MKTSLCRKWKIGRKIYYFDSGKEYETEKICRNTQDMIREIKEEEGKRGVLGMGIGTERSKSERLGPLIG